MKTKKSRFFNMCMMIALVFALIGCTERDAVSPETGISDATKNLSSANALDDNTTHMMLGKKMVEETNDFGKAGGGI